MAKPQTTRGGEQPRPAAASVRPLFAGKARNQRGGAVIAGVGLLLYILGAYLLLPRELPGIWQPLLGLGCVGLALWVYLLSTRQFAVEEELLRRLRQGQHTDFGKELRTARTRRRAIRLPGIGEISARLLGGVGVCLVTAGWWLTPWAPVRVKARTIEDLSVPLGEEIVAAVLVWPDRSLAVLQTPVPSVRAQEAARLISEGAGPYPLALKAIVAREFDVARSLLRSAAQGNAVTPAQIELALAQTEMYACRFPDAVPHYAKAVEQKPDDPLLLAQAAVASVHVGDLKSAETLIHRAAKKCRQKSADEGICLHLQAILCAGRGQQSSDETVRKIYDEAMQKSYDAREIFRQALGAEQPLVAASLNNQASLYLLRGKYRSGADQLFRDARDLWAKTAGPDDPSVATGLVNLAVMDCQLGRYSEAEDRLQRALMIHRQRLPEGHPLRAVGLNVSALIHHARAQYAEAQSDAEQALKLVEKTLGGKQWPAGMEHATVVAILDTLGTIYAAEALYVKADQYYGRAATVTENTWGKKSPYLAAILDHRARVDTLQGRWSDAEMRCQQALDIYKQTFGEEHPGVAEALLTRGRLEIARGQSREARTFLEKALAIQQKILGSDHPDSLLILGALAALENSSQTYPKGVSQYKKAVRLAENVLGAEHPEVARLLFGLAVLHVQQEKPAEAEPCLERALAIQEKVLPKDSHPDLAATLELYAKVLPAVDPPQPDQAAEAQTRAKRIRTKHGEVDRGE